MREIKFRAWDGENMLPINSLDFDENGKISVSVYSKEVGKSWYSEGGAIMQFTGLKDKDGKEIYEGDILKVWDMNRGCDCEDELDGKEPVENEHRPNCECYVTTQEIKWSNWAGYFCEEDTGNGCMPLGSDEFELEIIGNIYENPELSSPTPLK